MNSTTAQDHPRNAKPYPHRWLITYTATAQTPLSIGDGRSESGRVQDPDEPSRIVWHNTVARDANGQPYLAASGLKGALRNWARALQLQNPELNITDLFGAEKGRDDTAERRPGFLDLHDAHLNPLREGQSATFANLAHANEATQTYIDAATRIDRDTQTVADRLLFNQERVASGAAFSGSFLLQHPDPEVGKKLVSHLLGLLNAASEPAQGGLALGGDTGRGMGRVNFTNLQVSHFGPAQFKKWVSNGAKGTWRDGAEKAPVPAAVFTAQQPDELALNIQFTSRFLVNEPSRTTKGQGANSVAHTPRLDLSGKPVLPATSLHGALRAQAERILRTLGLDPGGAGGQPFDPSSPGGQLIAALYGHTDRAAALEQAAPPRCTNPGASHTQDFIAIDRFTGGGKDGAKYNAQSVYCPAFEARLRLNAQRFNNALRDAQGENAKLQAAARGLLLLTLRDLAEGDIPLGWGKRKGYGACQANGSGGQDLIAAATDWLGQGAPQALGAADNWLQALRALRPQGAPTASLPPDLAQQLAEASQGHTVQGTQGIQGMQGVQGTPASPAADRFHNSYHFVPLETPADLPDWVKRQAFKDDKKSLGHHSHARYASQTRQSDGAPAAPVFSGRITCVLTAETPFIVGGSEQNGQRKKNADGSTTVHPYQLPDGQLAIPASSLKGLISSIAEAASGSALRVLDIERPITYRMRSEDAYKRMGYVFQVGNEWRVLPLTEPSGKGARQVLKCNPKYAARVKLTEAAAQQEGHVLRVLDLDHPKEFGKRDLPMEAGKPLRSCEIQINDRAIEQEIKKTSAGVTLPEMVIAQFHQMADERTQAHFGRDANESPLTDIDESDKVEWAALPYHLVATTWDSPSSSWASEFGYGTRNLNTSPKNRTEQFQLRIKAGDVIYFNQDTRGITSVAYSQIWRSLVKKGLAPASYADFLPCAALRPLTREDDQHCHQQRDTVSPAETLFGFVEILQKESDNPASSQPNPEREPALAFAGKLRFSDALPQTAGLKAPEAATPLKLLANPKPPSPALYFKQRKTASTAQAIAKRDLNPQDHQLNGRKTYLHALGVAQGQAQNLLENGAAAPKDANGLPPWQARRPESHAEQRTHAKLLPARNGNPRGTPSDDPGTHGWRFTIDFDNLSLAELQLLAYSLRPAPEFRHKLGLGKAIGLGSVRLDPESLALIDRLARYAEQTAQAPRHSETLQASTLSVLASAYRDSPQGSPAARQALGILGDPGNVTHPVHVPQLQGGDIEDKTYEWFVQNDRVGTNGHHHSLPPLGQPGSANALPTLERTGKKKGTTPSGKPNRKMENHHH